VATAHTADPARPQARVAPGAFAILLLVLLFAAAFAAGRLARERAAADLADRAAAALPLATASLAAVIEKQRLIPTVLSRDPEVVALLAAPVDHARALLNAKLAEIAAEAASAVIYLVGRDGIAIAASNAGTPQSFVGSDYAFRSYFTRAMAEGAAQQYALGTVSGRPGLYLSRRVDSVLGPLGVVVVKVEFDELEARWRESGLVVQVTDAAGVVLATTDPAWRFGTTRPLADEPAAREGLQLDRPLAPVPVGFDAAGRARIDGAPFVLATGPVGPSAPGWSLAAFLPAEPALTTAARGAQVTALLAGLLLAGAGLALLRRRRWALARQAALAAMNSELERRVARRTDELNRSNTALATEIAERAAAETRARRLRDELAQANRLSILGQVSAGIAHEINQPLAAIRTYAETGGRLLDAGQPAESRANLREIVSITDRIGAIIQTLRGFARRGSGEIRPIEVAAAIDSALALLAGRIRDAGVAIVRGPLPPGVRVTAGRIRLEQILVNLLQNALDAVRDVADPTITLTVAATPDTVRITVADNGAGVPQAIRDQLFIPFTTTKPQGLGLGLVISSDLAREFSGALGIEPAGPAPGAAFTLAIPRTP
jgi:two-component system C4-dicarboxylate transport sensor histidine kinase DctB